MGKGTTATKIALIALSLGLVAGCNRGGNNMAANKAADSKAANSAAPVNAPRWAGDSGIRGNEGIYLQAGGIRPRDGAPATVGDGIPTDGFGASKADLLERVIYILGPPDERLPQTDDCGPGVREMVGWRGGLTLFFSDTAFIGWSASMPASGPPVRFEQGLGPGSSRADLESLDNRLLLRQADDLHLAFDSEQADARIREMWSGRTCAQEPGEQIRPN